MCVGGAASDQVHPPLYFITVSGEHRRPSSFFGVWPILILGFLSHKRMAAITPSALNMNKIPNWAGRGTENKWRIERENLKALYI